MALDCKYYNLSGYSSVYGKKLFSIRIKVKIWVSFRVTFKVACNCYSCPLTDE